MGKFIPDREFIFGNEARIREVLADYNTNIHKFEQKDSRRAGVRARNNLLELFHLCRARRKEILERSKDIHEQRQSLEEHPSWEGIEDEYEPN